MAQFRCSVSWHKIKRMKEPYFQWLHQSKVYLNLAKFKSDTLVVCGFLLGAHPRHLRRDDAEKEFATRLELPADFPFQLSSRTISVPVDNNKDSKRYSFPAVAVETSARQAKSLRETFFAQPKPELAKVKFPCTGPYQFVPTLQSKEWPVIKIVQLAKVLVKICQDLKPIFLQNLQDIRNAISADGHTLMRGFLGMTRRVDDKLLPLIHSVHNTNRPHVKAVLVTAENFEAAVDQFGTIYQDLLGGVPQEFQNNVFVDDLEAGLTSGHRDTIHSCNSSLHASKFLHLYNPQDAEVDPDDNPQKRFRPTFISYAAAASATSTITVATPSSSIVSQPITQTTSAPASLTDEDLDKLYERLKHHVNIEDGVTTGITTDDMERMVAVSNSQILQVREEMRTSVVELSAQIATVSESVKRQNVCVVGVQKMLESSSADIKNIVNEKVTDLTAQINNL